ncbi:hypothetical protein GCM10010389_35280 [Streptomyces echinoruber]|uniref:Uncharacterized protein n=1 Tax=Streptomyces echinoruber TaxID=68898 RepID=A0A918VES3_9ACTN|nr:hypothetical protein GCM10010389_35280 [Streptomyces echinoruber]
MDDGVLGIGGHRFAPFRVMRIPYMRMTSEPVRRARRESVRAAYAGPARTRRVNGADPAPLWGPGPRTPEPRRT